MELRISNLHKLSQLLVFVLLSVGIASAEDLPNNADEKRVESDSARYMIRQAGDPNSGQLIERPTSRDFTWEVLTKNSPAAGDSPLIGKLSGRPYYDFKDGLSAPLRVVE